MIFLFYDLIFLLAMIIYAPVYFWRGKITFSALKQKIGLLPEIKENKAVWIQAVSVGEAVLIEDLVKKIKEQYKLPIVISTTTLTGQNIARQKYSSLAKVIFFPFDISFIVKRALNIIKPEIFIAVETEVWPNLFRLLKKKSIPIVIVNGRISDKAFKRYKLIKPLMKKFLDYCDYIGVQNSLYRDRFIYLGASPDKVIISGNMKLAGPQFSENKLQEAKEKYLPVLKKQGRLLLVAASTHLGEEEAILEAYKDILKAAGSVNLLIAPRHPQRAAAVEKIVTAKGFYPVKISQLPSADKTHEGNVYIADTVGLLLHFYSISDICFVGGSLVPHGGHNILEPLYFSKPVVFGPYMNNFSDIERIVLEKNAAIKVQSEKELKDALLNLAKDKTLRDKISVNSSSVFENMKQSLENNLKLVSKCLKK